MTNAVLNMETAYSELRPLFFGAFSRLARQGFAAAPTDTLDLIHDFFTEAWPGVTRNYDPGKGPFEKYVFVAFVHFVRPRIINANHVRSSSIAYDQIIEGSKEELRVEPNVDSRIDVQRLNSAINHLSEFEHHLVKHYLSFESPSERALAKKFDLSRYKLRAALIGALGKIVVWLDRPSSVSTLDWNVALSIWRDKHSFAGAAKCHGLTIHQIKSSNLRMLQFLSQVLSDYHAWDLLNSRSTNMSTKRMAKSAEALLTEALKSANNQELLEQVRLHADEILAGIARSDQFGPEDDELVDLDNEWLARCYNALTNEKVSESEEEFYATADDEESVGKAYSQALMAIDRDDIRRLQGFESLPAIDEAEAAELLETPAAQGAGSDAEPLARVGLTPLSVFYGTEAVSYLIERLIDQELIPRDNTILLKDGDLLVNDEHHDVLSWTLLTDEVRRVAVCDRETAVELYRWLIQVAQYRPYIFAGFEAEPVAQGAAVRLSAIDNKFANLYQRWGIGHVQVPTEEAAASV